jgi:hypothetical protein
MGPKTFQIEPRRVPEPLKWSPNGAKLESKRRKNKKKSQGNKIVGGVPRRRAILTESGAYMAPTWASKWSQDAQKIDPEIDHFC